MSRGSPKKPCAEVASRSTDASINHETKTHIDPFFVSSFFSPKIFVRFSMWFPFVASFVSPFVSSLHLYTCKEYETKRKTPDRECNRTLALACSLVAYCTRLVDLAFRPRFLLFRGPEHPGNQPSRLAVVFDGREVGVVVPAFKIGPMVGVGLG